MIIHAVSKIPASEILAPPASRRFMAMESTSTPSTEHSRSTADSARGVALRPRRLLAPMLVYLVLVTLHLLAGLRMEQPLILADELGYLGNARYLAGVADLPNLQESQFYHFGYSLFLVPAFWLFSEPLASYKAAMTINALLMSAVYFPLRSILITVLGATRALATWIAFACCLYPAAMLYSNFAWSENAFVPFFALTSLVFARLLHSRSTRDVVFFALLAGFLYTIHPRALPLLVVVIVWLVALPILGALSRIQALIGVSTLTLVFVATRLVNGHLKSLGWSGSGEFSVARLVERLLPGSQFPMLARRAFGQALYLSDAAYGLSLLGLLVIIGLFVVRARRTSLARAAAEPRAGWALFVCSSGAAVFAASLAVTLYGFYGREGIRGAGFLPGRYNEAWAVVLLAVGLAACGLRWASLRTMVRRTFAVALVIVLLTVVVSVEIDAFLATAGPAAGTHGTRLPVSNVNAVEVPGLFPVIHMLGELNLYLVSLAALVLFFAVVWTMWLSPRGGLGLLILVFLSFTLLNYRHYLQPELDRARPRISFAHQLSALGPVASISFDTSQTDLRVLHTAQYLLPKTRFELFASSLGESPRSEVVISRNDWQQAADLEAEPALHEGNGSLVLWLLPGTIRSGLEAIAYEGRTLGAEPVFGVQESGFHPQEWLEGGPARWTDGAATLSLSLAPEQHPRHLEVELIEYEPGKRSLEVLANGSVLFRGTIPTKHWRQSFSLAEVGIQDRLVIQLNSDVFRPPGSHRELGLLVRGVRLTDL